ncbi:hypothetical protein PCIT_a3376 [Pseudoalteromonas citrea]|uniref:Tail specific protease domain-containing protein n=2 Tax=Pseudoalteromonas citrea TaxID=43655 RepID=A0AAD4AGU0_9GAMM|nr:S41 family peptidase [Pseudoalteromonas citrea]KAF7768860.1 hypothetical protein PCIT_a3376 [Pseudoalteromonas citrea]
MWKRILSYFATIYLVSACGSGSETAEQSDQAEVPIVTAPPIVELQSKPAITYSSSLQDDIVSFVEVAQQIRFFYPSDSVANSQWDAFIAEAIVKLSQISKQERLAESFQILHSIAPHISLGVAIPNEPGEESRVSSWLANSSLDDSVFTRKLIRGTYKNLQSDIRHAQEWFYTTQLYNEPLHIPLYLNEHESSDGSTYNGFDTYDMSHSIGEIELCMAAASHIWAEIQHFWPYFSEVDVNWKLEHKEMLSACLLEDPQDTWQTIFASMNRLQDQHISIHLPTHISPSSSFEWILPFRPYIVEGKAIITRIHPDALNLVELGDELVTIDNEPIEQMIERNAQVILTSKHNAKYQSLKSLFLRRDDTQIEATLKKMDGTTYTVLFEPLPISAMAQRYTGNRLIYRYDYMHEVLDEGVHHLVLYKLSQAALSQVREQLSSAKGIVIDLRHYPEDFFAWLHALGWFSSQEISSAPIYEHWQRAPNQSSSNVQRVFQFIQPKGDLIDKPIVVLASRDSISQNEHALAYIQNAGLTIMGEATAGINGNIQVQSVFSGPDNGGVTFIYTGLQVTQNDGSSLIGVGIQPDITVPISRESIVEGTDNQLARAVEYILQQQ